MGKKSKAVVKSTNKMTKGHPIDASNLKISELCLEEFEKSLASMLESLSSKKIEILQTCAYNSKSDPSTVIGKINAKYILDEDESVESLQQKIITAANPDVYLNTKLVAVKSSLATSSDTTNSSQDEMLKGRSSNHKPKAAEESRQENVTIYRPRRFAHSDPRKSNKSSQDSITPPPQRGTIDDLRKSFSDSKRRRFERANEGLNNSFSHFKNYKELIEMNPNIYMKANKHFIIDELSLETILEKIYLEAYSFEDLREYVYSALKKVVSLDDFLDILYSSIQNYSLRVKEHIMEALDEVMIKTKQISKAILSRGSSLSKDGKNKKYNLTDKQQQEIKSNYILNSISNSPGCQFLNPSINNVINQNSITSSLNNKEISPSNIHLNMNITNININNNSKNCNTNGRKKSKCLQDDKVINDLKEILRKKSINYNQRHFANNYILEFDIQIPSNNPPKHYAITIDHDTSKILHYEKKRGDNPLIIIDNIEDSTELLIFNELSNLRKEIELNFIK